MAPAKRRSVDDPRGLALERPQSSSADAIAQNGDRAEGGGDVSIQSAVFLSARENGATSMRELRASASKTREAGLVIS